MLARHGGPVRFRLEHRAGRYIQEVGRTVPITTLIDVGLVGTTAFMGLFNNGHVGVFGSHALILMVATVPRSPSDFFGHGVWLDCTFHMAIGAASIASATLPILIPA